MRLCSYIHEGQASYGAAVGDEVLDLKAALGAAAPATLDELIAAVGEGRITQAQLQRAADAATVRLPQSGLAWLPPVARPGKILGVAINNRIGQALAHRPFANPAFFFKPRTSLVGHGQPVVVRDDYGVTHPEPELAVVIGRTGKDIAEADALSYVFGYTIINDVTSPGLKEGDSIEIVTPKTASGGYRDLLEWRRVPDEESARSIYLTYHARSKGADTFGPLGPWIVTRDEIADPNRLAINSYDGDDLVFEDSTANLTFSVQRIIAHASRYMTLEAGDVIHCGTAMKAAEGAKYRGLTDWDIRKVDKPMVVDIEGIGRLVSPVVHER